MFEGKYIFSQLMDFVPWRRLQTCVNRYNGDYKIKTYQCAEQFRVMAFAQLTYRHSLREVEACLRAVQSKLYHIGIHSSISHSNMAHANQTRDWRIYADFAQILIQRAKQLYMGEDLGLDLDSTVYALDSTTIDLCLSLFPWAKFRHTKAAVKLHTLLNLQGDIPEYIWISDGKLHDVNVLDYLLPVPGAYYVMDRGYLDFERLYVLHQAKSHFVIRGQSRWRTMRSNGNTGYLLFRPRLSGAVAPDSLLRCGTRQATNISDQRFHSASDHDCGSLQIALASRTVFQMDKATPSNKVLLWNERECRKTTNLDCRINLLAGGNPQKGTSNFVAAVHNFTGSQPYAIRENAHY
jgi:hypothetical protein